MEHVGIDVHKQESEICVLTGAGEVQRQRIRTRRSAFAQVFEGRARAQVLVEASTESEWVAQALEALGHEVIVADPGYAPMYPRRRRVKTDRRDAEALAVACRQGTYRPVHRVSAARRALREQLRVRDTLVATRTRTISVIRALARGAGCRIGSGTAEHFVARLETAALPAALAARLAPLRELLAHLAPAIAAADEAVAAVGQAEPMVAQLQSAPGVGPVTSVAFVARLDDVTRFRSAHAAEAYLGLVPGEWSSGGHVRRGHLTKAGDPRTRALLVQAAWSVLRSRRRDARPLQHWAAGIARRRGRRIAVVALARRLAGILFAMWRDDTTYDVTRLRGAVA